MVKQVLPTGSGGGGGGGSFVGQGVWEVAFFRQTEAADPADGAPVDTGIAYDREYEWAFTGNSFASSAAILVGSFVDTFWGLATSGGSTDGARPSHIVANGTFIFDGGLSYLQGWLNPTNTGVGDTDQSMLTGSPGAVDIYLKPSNNHFLTFNNGGTKAKTIIIKRKLISP